MKKQLFITTDGQGFIFPYVLFVVSLALIILTASIQSYQSEISIAYNQSEQLKIETLIQMSRTQLANDLSNQPESNGEKSYNWPYGDVTVKYTKLNDQTYWLYFQIKTDNGAKHSLRNQLTVTSE
ncbi:hypothetical protein GCM10028778_09640 [Barrientosiimonas marina]|uniref:Competence type IV pilus minor pilin ComGG n=1 Tax=Lentibacillus kimchii TaxID=1542911 RepID=A0ABW2UW22_9BACI